MSNVVDERVAALKFDNSQFEKGVQTSLNTLDKLKASLNFSGQINAFREIENAASRVTFYKMANSVTELEHRFSALGIAGMTVIQDLTRTVENFVVGTMSGLFNKIAEGGKRRAMNVEQARFLLQGLIDDSTEIEAIMQNAKDSVTDTAYGYDQAAMAAAQFATSGVQSGEQMSRTLSAVAGVAATTNSEYASISDIFTKAAGQGRLMGEELMRLSSRGLNAAATIAKYFNNVQSGSAEATDSVKASIAELTGGLQVTEAEIREWTSKGKISFDMFAGAMAESFGKHAKDANKTVTGVLSNINARFSQIGEKFFTPLITQEGPLVTFLNKVMNKFGEVRDSIQPIADLFTNTVIRLLEVGGKLIDAIPVKQFFEKINGYLDPISKKIDGIFGLINKTENPVSKITKESIDGLGLSEKALDHFQNVLKDVAKEHNIDIDSMLDSETSFWDTLKEGWLTSDLFEEAINKLTTGTEEATEGFDKLKEAAEAVIRGDYGNGAERIEALTAAGLDPQKVQDFVDKVHELAGGTWELNDAVWEAAAAELGLSSNLEAVSDEELEALGYTKDDIAALRELSEETKNTNDPLTKIKNVLHDVKTGFDLLYDSAKNVVGIIMDVGGLIKDSFLNAFPQFKNFSFDIPKIPNLLDLLRDFNEFTKNFSFSDDAKEKISSTFTSIFEIIAKVIDAIRRFISFALPPLTSLLSKVIPFVINAVSTIAEKITEFSNKFSISDKTLNNIVRTLKGVWAAADIIFRLLSTIVKNLIGPFIVVLTYVFDFILDKTALLGDILVKIDEAIKKSDLFNNIASKISEFFSKLKLPKNATDFFEGIKNIGDTVKQIDFGSGIETLKKVVGDVVEFISKFFSLDFVVAAGAFYLMYRLIKAVATFIIGVASIPKNIERTVANVATTIKQMGTMFTKIGKLADKLAIASIIIAITFAFGEIAKGIASLASIDTSKIKQAIVLTVLIAGVVIGIYAAIASMDAKANIRPSLEAIAFMFIAAKAVKDVAKAIYSLNDMNIGQIFAAAGALLGVLSIMGVIAGVLSKLETKLSISALLFPILYAKGLKDIGKALSVVKDMKWNQMLAGGIALLGVLSIMGVIAGVLSKLETKLSISALLFPVLYAKGLKGIADALISIKDLTDVQLINGILALLDALGVMAVIAVFLSKLETKLSVSALLFPVLYTKGLKNIADALVSIKDLTDVQLINGILALLDALGVMAVIAVFLSKLETKLSISALLFPVLYAKGLKDIADALISIKDLTDVQLINGILALLDVLGVMAVIAVFLSKLETKLSISALLFPVLYAHGLIDIAKAFVMLKDFTDDELIRGGLALLGSLSVMAVIASLLSDFETKLSLSALVFPILYAHGLIDIAKAFVMLKDFTNDDLISGGLALLGSLAVMAVIASLLSDFETKLSISALLFPVVYANGLLTIAKAFFMLKGLSEEELIAGMVALNGSLVIMAIIAEVLSGLEAKLSLSVLAMPIAFAAGLLLLALAMRTVGTMATGELVQGFGAMLTSMIVLGFIVTLMGSFSAELKAIADTLLHFAVSAVLISISFGIVSLGLIALAYAINMFEGVNIEQVGLALVALAGAMAILVVAANALTVTGVGLIFLGTAFLMISVSIYVLVEALVLLANNFDNIAEMMPKIGAAIVNGIGGAITGLLNLIVQNLPLILAAGIAIVAALALGISLGPVLIIAAIGLLVYSGLKWLADTFGIDGPKLGLSLVEGLGNGILGGISWLGKKVHELGDGVINTIKGIFGINSPSKLMALFGLDIDAGLGKGVDAGSGMPVSSMGNMAGLMKGEFETNMFDGSLFSMGEKAGNEISDGVESGAANPSISAADMADDVKEKVSEELGDTDYFFNTGSSIPESVTDGMMSGSDDMSNYYKEALESLGLDGMNFTSGESNDFFGTGEIIPESITDGLTSGTDGLSDSYMKSLEDLQLDGLDFASGDSIIGIGEAWDLSQVEGLNNNSDKVNEAAETVAGDAAEAAGDTESDWRGVGKNLVDALSEGIRNGRSNAIDAAVDVAAAAYNAAKSELQINSPSKLFIRLGKGIDEGFIRGMELMSSNVVDTSRSVATGIVDAAKKPLDSLADLMSGDMITDPTITPVLDLSEIQNGTDRLYAMLPESEQLSFSGNVRLANDASLSITRDRRQKEANDNEMMNSLINAINGLSALIGTTGNVYNVNGVTYDDGSNVSSAVRSLIHAAKIGGRM